MNGMASPIGLRGFRACLEQPGSLYCIRGFRNDHQLTTNAEKSYEYIKQGAVELAQSDQIQHGSQAMSMCIDGKFRTTFEDGCTSLGSVFVFSKGPDCVEKPAGKPQYQCLKDHLGCEIATNEIPPKCPQHRAPEVYVFRSLSMIKSCLLMQRTQHRGKIPQDGTSQLKAREWGLGGNEAGENDASDTERLNRACHALDSDIATFVKKQTRDDQREDTRLYPLGRPRFGREQSPIEDPRFGSAGAVTSGRYDSDQNLLETPSHDGSPSGTIAEPDREAQYETSRESPA